MNLRINNNSFSYLNDLEGNDEDYKMYNDGDEIMPKIMKIKVVMMMMFMITTIIITTTTTTGFKGNKSSKAI